MVKLMSKTMKMQWNLYLLSHSKKLKNWLKNLQSFYELFLMIKYFDTSVPDIMLQISLINHEEINWNQTDNFAINQKGYAFVTYGRKSPRRGARENSVLTARSSNFWETICPTRKALCQAFLRKCLVFGPNYQQKLYHPKKYVLLLYYHRCRCHQLALRHQIYNSVLLTLRENGWENIDYCAPFPYALRAF